MCYSNTRCRIKIGGGVYQSIQYPGGAWSRDVHCLHSYSTWSWSGLCRTPPPTGSPILIGNTTLDRLAYADDIDLCGEELPYIEDIYMEFKIVAGRTGLEVSIPKTKIMEVAGVPSIIGDQQFGGSTLEAETTFKYLGSTVTSSNLIDEEIRLRIAAGSRCSWALDATFKSRMLSRATKTQIYTTISRPIVIYGCETWRLTKELERRLNVFERDILRRIWGPVWDEEEGEWCRPHNHELMTLSGVPKITNIIRSHRLRWAGHVSRIEDGRLAKELMVGKPMGTKPLGRPGKRWIDNVKEDMTTLGANPDAWMQMAEDRVVWRQLVRCPRSKSKSKSKWVALQILLEMDFQCCWWQSGAFLLSHRKLSVIDLSVHCVLCIQWHPLSQTMLHIPQ